MKYFLCWIISGLITISHAATENKFDFLAMADIHFDPFIYCGNKKPCPLIQKLRDTSVKEWPVILEKENAKWPHFREDTNYQLLKSALSAGKQMAEKNHAQFVLLLGDSLGHEFRNKYKRFSDDKAASHYSIFTGKTLTFLTNELSAAFPSVDVYNVVGNNDSYSGNYVIKPNSLFFSETGRLWSGLIKDSANQASMQKQFSHAGYYSIVLPEPKNLRLIVMNTNIFSGRARGKNLDVLALGQLNWLHAELQKAKDAHQRVLIAMHIPQGIDIYATQRTRLFRLITLWKPQYVTRFDAILNQFAAEIAGIFSGHVHRNWFHILTFNDSEIPVVGITSISPIFGNYPGFRNISYLTDPIRLDDISTYSFPLHGTVWAKNKITPDQLAAIN